MVLLALLVGCAEAPTLPRQGVVVVLGGARPAAFSSHGYPRPTTPQLDALATRGLSFQAHYTQATTTREAFSSLLFARYDAPPLYPDDAEVPFYAPTELFGRAVVEREESDWISLPALCRRAGLKTGLISAHPWVRQDSPLAREFDVVHDLVRVVDVDPDYGHPRADAVVDSALQWVRSHAGQDFLLVVHLADLYAPYPLGEQARRFLSENAQPITPAALEAEGGRAPSRSELAYLNALADGSLAYADQELGRLFAALDSELEHEPLVLVTGDHGEHAWRSPKRRFDGGGDWTEGRAHIPWILVAPGVTPAVRDELTETVDVLPTVAHLLRLDLPAYAHFDGADRSQAASKREYVLGPRAIRTWTHRAIFETPDAILLGPERPSLGDVRGVLFDLEEDPAEEVDLWNDRRELAAHLLDLYRAHKRDDFARWQTQRGVSDRDAPFAVRLDYARSETPFVPAKTLANPFGARVGWFELESGDRLHWLGGRQAKELELTFPLPNGEYEVALSLRGRAHVRLGGGPEVLVDGGRSLEHTDLPGRTTLAGAGSVTITDERFVASIRPDPSYGVLVLGYLAFEPLAPAGEEPASVREASAPADGSR